MLHENVDRLGDLLKSGLLCGVLWELWNYWSRAKWHYSVPIMANLRVFEMPLPGYLGFPAFALECFTMYECVRLLFSKAGIVIGPPHAPLTWWAGAPRDAAPVDS